MLDRFRKLAAFLALLSLMAVPAAAGPLEDGAAAYDMRHGHLSIYFLRGESQDGECASAQELIELRVFDLRASERRANKDVMLCKPALRNVRTVAVTAVGSTPRSAGRVRSTDSENSFGTAPDRPA